jgi:hypothetical protein
MSLGSMKTDLANQPLALRDRVVIAPLRKRYWDSSARTYRTEPVPPNTRLIFATITGITRSYWMVTIVPGQVEQWFVGSSLVKVPDALWFNEEKTKAYLILAGLGEEFGYS